MGQIDIELMNQVVLECYFVDVPNMKGTLPDVALFFVSLTKEVEEDVMIPVAVDTNRDVMGVWPVPGDKIKIYGELRHIRLNGLLGVGIYATKIIKY